MKLFLKGFVVVLVPTLPSERCPTMASAPRLVSRAHLSTSPPSAAVLPSYNYVIFTRREKLHGDPVT